MKSLFSIRLLFMAIISLGNIILLAGNEDGGTSSSSVFQTEVSNVGTNAAAFLEIGVGARAMAMGGSYVAVANDPTALYYNPAGIVWIENIQIELMHNKWLVDTNYEFFGLTMPLPF